MEAVERALDADKECGEILQLIAGARGAMNGLTAELLVSHIRDHVIDPRRATAKQREAADELISVVQSYFK